MKHMLKGFLSAAVVLSVAGTLDAKDSWGQPYFAGRSQGMHWNRQMVGVTDPVHRFDTDCLHGTVSLVGGYGRSFNDKDLGKYFSPKEDSNTFVVGPRGDSTVDVINTTFLLPDALKQEVTLNPRVDNAFINPYLYLGLDEWVCGLWFEANVPVVWTKWDLRATEKEYTGTDFSIANTWIGAGTAPNFGGSTTSPYKSFLDAWKGTKPLTTNAADVKNGMQYGRVDGKQTKWGLADLELALGYDFVNNECSHLGVSFRVIAPTGTRPAGVYVFEPIIGGGKNTHLGGGITGHYEFWNNCCDSSFSMHFNARVFTQLETSQIRAFDWKKNGKWSRYLLLKEFNASKVYNEVLEPGANVTTLEAKVKTSVIGEGVLMFDYQHCNFNFDLGYDFWGRSKEKISCITGTIDKNYGIAGGTTVVAGNNNVDTAATIKSFNNPGTTFATPLTIADLDKDGAEAPSAFSHKVFGNLGYTWNDCDFMPFIGVGGEVEFAGKDNNSFEQWAVWLKGGFSFN